MEQILINYDNHLTSLWNKLNILHYLKISIAQQPGILKCNRAFFTLRILNNNKFKFIPLIHSVKIINENSILL